MEWRAVRASSSKRQWCRRSLYIQMRKGWQRQRVVGAKPGLLKGLNVVSESTRRYICRRPPCWGAQWLGSAGRDAATKHASKWHSNKSREPGRPQGLQPVDMLVMSSSVAGSSYRSVVTFSGQGRLNDILTWNKAKGRVNAKYKQHSVKVCYSGPARADVQMSGIRRLQPSHKHSWMIPGKIAAESANGWKNNTLTMIPIMCRRQWDGISTFSCLKSTLRVNISGILTFLLGSTCSQWNWSSSPSRSPTWTWEQMSFCWPKTWRLCRLRSCSATLPECRRTLDKTPLLTPFTGHLRWY